MGQIVGTPTCECPRVVHKPDVFLCDACDAAICAWCALEMAGGAALARSGEVSQKTIGHYLCASCRARGLVAGRSCPCPACRGSDRASSSSAATAAPGDVESPVARRWGTDHARDVARQFAEGEIARSWSMIVPALRRAAIDSAVVAEIRSVGIILDYLARNPDSRPPLKLNPPTELLTYDWCAPAVTGTRAPLDVVEFVDLVERELSGGVVRLDGSCEMFLVDDPE